MISAASTTPDPAEAPGPAPLRLVYDGGCPFCRHFALTSELRGGLGGLEIVDGRAEAGLRRALNQRGYDLADGAVLIEGDRLWHGADAIARLCAQLRPSPGLLALLAAVFGSPARSRRLYPLLLALRQGALALKGLPVDPDSQP